MEFKSPTYGTIKKQEVFYFLKKAIQKNDGRYKIIVGSDSQNTYKTKMVVVVCLVKEGHGGIFFYHIDLLPKVRDLNIKIYTETEKSLEIARELNEYLYREGVRAEVEIHVDIGREGKTKNLINGILGWIRAEGFEVRIKDESYVASSIADRISK